MKASYTFKDLKQYYFSLLAMIGLRWVTLAGLIWLGLVLVVHYVQGFPLLAYFVHLLSGLWMILGWALLALFAILLVTVLCFRKLHPSMIKHFASSWSTSEFLRWLRSGVAVASEDGSVKVQSTKPLEGFIAYLSGGLVLVAVFVPRGLGGKALADSSTEPVKEYADGVLPGMKSGAVQHTAGARYWIYRRSDM